MENVSNQKLIANNLLHSVRTPLVIIQGAIQISIELLPEINAMIKEYDNVLLIKKLEALQEVLQDASMQVCKVERIVKDFANS